MDENVLDWQQDTPSMADLFREAQDLEQPRPGDIRRGTVVAISEKGISVDVHAKQKGFIPRSDLAKLPSSERESLREGQEVLVYVTGEGDAQEMVQLSLYLAKKELDWLKAENLLRQNAVWKGTVSGYNKGGLVVPFGHIRGFVPASQITGFPRDLSGEEKLSRLAEMVGTLLSFQVVDVDRRQRRLVLSERLGRTAGQSKQQQQLLSQLRKGDICRGRVRALTDYGAFVDLGGAVGLIHRTELAWFRVEHPCEIVQEGQELEAYVLRVNRDRARVSLSLKRTYDDPWPTVTERYQLGQLVETRVIRQTGAGLFTLTDDGVLGFISGADSQDSKGEEKVAVGQRILARLVRIDGARRRLGLSIRRVKTAEWEAWRDRLGQQTVDETDMVEHAPSED